MFTGSLANNGTLIVNRAGDVAFSGALTGAGLLVKEGVGRVTFGSGYAFTGTTQLNGGAIRLTTPVAATTELDLGGSGQIDVSGTNQTIAELQEPSALASVFIAGGSLTVNQATSTSFAGTIVGAGSLTKAGTGTLNRRARLCHDRRHPPGRVRRLSGRRHQPARSRQHGGGGDHLCRGERRLSFGQALGAGRWTVCMA